MGVGRIAVVGQDETDLLTTASGLRRRRDTALSSSQSGQPSLCLSSLNTSRPSFYLHHKRSRFCIPRIDPILHLLSSFGFLELVDSSQPAAHLLTLPLSTMENQKISDFLTEQLSQAPEQSQPFFLSFEDYWERKLWHQLTDILIDFFRTPESAPQRLAIFKSFVLSFADRINQLKFVSLGLMASTECTGGLCSNAWIAGV